MNYKKTLDSGAVLEVTLAPFAVGHRLLKAVMSEIEQIKISIGDVKDISTIFSSEMNDSVINTIKNLITRVLSSDVIEEALWVCMERATYDGKKITRDTFEDMNVRADYFIVAKEVLWFNLTPFFKNLKSIVSIPPLGSTTTPKLSSKGKNPSS